MIRNFSERRSAGHGTIASFAFLNAASANKENRPVSVTKGSTTPDAVAILYRRVDDALALVIPVTLANYMMHARYDVGHVI